RLRVEVHRDGQRVLVFARAPVVVADAGSRVRDVRVVRSRGAGVVGGQLAGRVGVGGVDERGAVAVRLVVDGELEIGVDVVCGLTGRPIQVGRARVGGAGPGVGVRVDRGVQHVEVGCGARSRAAVDLDSGHRCDGGRTETDLRRILDLVDRVVLDRCTRGRAAQGDGLVAGYVEAVAGDHRVGRAVDDDAPAVPV